MLAALRDAQALPLSYGVRVYEAPGGATLVVLGEAHLKLARAERVGNAVVEAFALRGVETVQIARIAGGRALYLAIHVPRQLLRLLTFGLVRGSTITHAKALREGRTVEIERGQPIPLGLHVGSVYLSAFFAVFWLQLFLVALGDASYGLAPLLLFFEVHMLAIVPAVLLRRHRWSWILHPAVAILTLRDTLMARGAVRMLAEHPDAPTAVVVVGRAHVNGLERELVGEQGFRRVEL